MPRISGAEVRALKEYLEGRDDYAIGELTTWCRDCGALSARGRTLVHDPTCATGILEAFLARHSAIKTDLDLAHERALARRLLT